MGIKTDPEVNRRVKAFAVELWRILLMKDIASRQKCLMAALHIMENKVWAVYFFVMLLATIFFVVAIIREFFF